MSIRTTRHEIDNNNYKARAIDIIALDTPNPDLTVEEIVVAPTGVGGEAIHGPVERLQRGKGRCRRQLGRRDLVDGRSNAAMST